MRLLGDGVITDVQGLPYLDLRKVATPFKPLIALYFSFCARKAIKERGLLARRTIYYRASDFSLLGTSPWPLTIPMSASAIHKFSTIVMRLEDKRFLRRRGSDWRALCRAALENVKVGRVVQGASTITHQLVRNTFVFPDRSISRKLLEWSVGSFVDRHFSKTQILDAYCRNVALGPGIRGFGAAARVYHRRTPDALSNYEVAAIAGCLRTPSVTSPLSSIAAYTDRARQIAVRTGVEGGLIPPGHSTPLLRTAVFRRPRLGKQVDRELQLIFSRRASIPPDIRAVQVTIVPELQMHLDSAVRIASRDSLVSAAAGVVMDAKTGAILAESAFGNGMQSHFSPTYDGVIQAGSTAKPFVFLAALEAGIDPAVRLMSSPFTWNDAQFEGGAWRVRNYGHLYSGALSLTDALVQSDNTVFARLVQVLGVRKALRRLADVGLTATEDRNPSAALGSAGPGVSLSSLSRAYAALANGGSLVTPHVVRGIERDCKARRDAYDYSRHVTTLALDENAVRSLDIALRRNGFSLGGRQIRGKSGTTRLASLYAAYDDELSYAIWIGFRSTQPEHWNKGLRARSVLERAVDGMFGRQSRFI